MAAWSGSAGVAAKYQSPSGSLRASVPAASEPKPSSGLAGPEQGPGDSAAVSRQDEHAVGLAVEVVRLGPGQCGSVETRAGERVLGDKMNRTGVAWLLSR